MKFGIAIIAAALAIATPALAQQSGVVTYTVTGLSPVSGATSVTVNYNTRTITWHRSDGFDYTEGDPSLFDTHAAMLADMYGDTPREVDGS